MGVLHRDGSRLKAELRGELFDLYRVIIRQQDVTFYLAKQAEQLSMVNLPVRIESSRGELESSNGLHTAPLSAIEQDVSIPCVICCI